MNRLNTPHILTGEELSREELMGLLNLADELKQQRAQGSLPPLLAGKHLALVFEKPSLRTRFSFSVAIQELGGHVVESLASNTKKEEPEDVARVLSGYVHAVMVRTHEQSTLERMASHSSIPVINGLSDTHHPCQTFADLLTLKQRFRKLEGLKITYIGDGNNILHSLLLLAPYLGVHVNYACPEGYGPSGLIVKKARARAKEGGGSIQAFSSPSEAVQGTRAIYTDVWVSMGFEAQERERERAFDGYQVNDLMLKLTAPDAIVLHCLPMLRGKEITDSVADGPHSAIFSQSENRLHVQKALLLGLIGK